MPTALITGANGFIGRALCVRVLADSWRVRGTVRRAESALLLPAAVEPILIASVDGETDWLESLTGVDCVVHLAARAHILKETSSDPAREFYRVNTLGAEHLARMAARAGVRRFVFISSIGVNGEQTHADPFSEDDTPNPTRPYAASKWEAEQRLWRIAKETGLELVVLRPPLVYGPGAKGNILRLMNYIHRQWPLPLGGIQNRRSFIGLANLVDALARSMNAPAAAGQLFLLSDDETVSTTQLVQLIAKHMNQKLHLFSLPGSFYRLAARMFPPVHQSIAQLTGSLVVDNRKFKSMLAWTPPASLDGGVAAMVHEYTRRSQPHDREKVL